MDRITQHPSQLIRKMQKDYVFNIPKPVTLGSQKWKTANIIGRIKKQIRLAKAAIDNIMNQFPDGADEITKETQDDFYYEIVLSSLSTKFFEKYQEELEEIWSAEHLMKFITSKLGTTTRMEDDRHAQKQLSMICRHISEDEKFTDFLGRIERLATRLDTGEQGKSYMISELSTET